MNRAWVAGALLVLAPGALFALTPAELQTRMAQADAALKTVSFDYVQELRSEAASEARRSSGTASIRKPRSLRIEQTDPERQLVVSDGHSVYVYTPRFHQVLKDSWKHWLSQNLFFPGLSGFSDTLKKLEEDYTWEILGEVQLRGEKTLALRLKKNGTPGESLDLWVGASDFIPRRSEVVSGTLKLSTTLTELRKNPDLAAGLFKFNKPKDARVIAVP